MQPVFASFFSSGNKEEAFAAALSGFRSRIEVLRTIAVYGAFWGRSQHRAAFAAIPQRLACDPNAGISGVHLSDSLRVIPSLMLLYAMGVAAYAHDNLEMLVGLLKGPSVDYGGGRKPYITAFRWSEVDGFFRLLPAHNRNHFPASEWLFCECRDVLRSLIPDEREYEGLFDRFEIIRSLAYVDLRYGGQVRSDGNSLSGPGGRFVWRYACWPRGQWRRSTGLNQERSGTPCETGGLRVVWRQC